MPLQNSRSAGRGVGGRVPVAIIAVFAAVFGGLLATTPASAIVTRDSTSSASASASTSTRAGATVAPAKHYGAGTYVVQLQDAPASTYSGGVAGYVATRPRAGHQLNAHAAAVRSYSAHLASAQGALLGRYAIHALHSYTIAYNGFAATLTATQATALAADRRVLRLTKDRTLKIQDDSLTSKGPLSYLKVDGDSGVWSALGGHEGAGAGVVIGEIDTGITPDNPSFAGAPLASTPSTSVPWLDTSTSSGSSAGTITYDKSDGTLFTSTEIASAPGWRSATDYSTKIIGAKFYDSGWIADGNAFATRGEYLSPRDGDGHGSHTSSTAAGDYGVDATVKGVDYGTISGLAPAARIAMYKACWSAPNPNDDGCDEADLLAAINQATIDGVDVINYSIGGDPAETVYSPTDEAFLNAAIAGIFVAAAGGNAGPGASTIDNASPWETTVAASTIPSYEATARLGNGRLYVGASITVRDVATADPATYSGRELTARIIDAGSAPKSGVSAAKASDCRTGSLDPKKVAGKVVVCDRDSVIPRLEMSATVAAAGGVGAILTNTVPGDVDLDQHSVPTIHVDLASRAAIHAYALSPSATVTFIPWNAVAVASPSKATPVPQIAGFSSRGPVSADGEDTLKPDLAAPGVSILAAYADDSSGHPQWGFDSGTSMATPHIAGLAALYLGLHPLASPAEIKSAMMTTASNTVTSSGAASIDPFAQGAGEVDPSRFLNPGLLYLAGKNDWEAYVAGTGESAFSGVAPIDPDELNQPSIAVGAFAASTTITRTVTAQAPGTWTASAVSTHGVTATVSPSALTFGAAGDARSYSVTFTRTTAPLHRFATGSISWTNSVDPAQTARIPFAVQPTTLPSSVSGTGTNGHATVPVSLPAPTTFPLHIYGLAPRVDAAPVHFTTASTRVAGGPQVSTLDAAHSFLDTITSATTYVTFSEAPKTTDSTSDLDLYVYYSATYSGSDRSRYRLAGASATPSDTESVSFNRPAPGHYLVVIDPYAVAAGGIDVVESSYQVKTTGGAGLLNVSPSSVRGATSGSERPQVRWGGLATNTSYLGLLQFGASARTLVRVTTGPTASTAIEEFAPPTLSGAKTVNARVTASPGTWDVGSAALGVTYRWNEDGTAIRGATGASLVPSAGMFDHRICVVATAHLAGVSTDSSPTCFTVHATSSTRFTIADRSLARGQHAIITATVATSPAAQLDGRMTIVVSGHAVTVSPRPTLRGSGAQTVRFSLPVLARGPHRVSVSYSGGSLAGGSTASAQLVSAH